MKAAMVDCASLWNMGKIMGYGRISYRGLRELLNTIGTYAFGPPPIASFTSIVSSPFFRAARDAGFDTRRSSRGHDDQAILNAMMPLVFPHIRELIIVSADGDYMETCDVKVAQGMKVYWVAAPLFSPGTGSPILGKRLLARTGSGKYEFVDLRPHVRKIFF